VSQDDDPDEDAQDACEQLPTLSGSVDEDADNLENALCRPKDPQQLDKDKQGRLGCRQQEDALQ
jgi:hypothetical protein